MVARPSAPLLLRAYRTQKPTISLKIKHVGLSQVISHLLTAEEAMIVDKSLTGVEIPEEDRDYVRARGMRLGLSAEKENRVHSSGFDSLILALNQMMLKVLLRAGLIATWTSLQIHLDSVAKTHSDLVCVGPEPHPTCGTFHRRCSPHAKVKLDTPAEISVFDGSREHQSDEFKGKRYSVIFHGGRVVTSLTDGLKRSLNNLRFPVVAAQSNNEYSLRFLCLLAGTKRKSSKKKFLEKEIGGHLRSLKRFQRNCQQP